MKQFCLPLPQQAGPIQEKARGDASPGSAPASGMKSVQQKLPRSLRWWKANLINFYCVGLFLGKTGEGGELQVWIKEAKNLTAAKSGGTSDSFVKG